jgi:hypothetical protein
MKPESSCFAALFEKHLQAACKDGKKVLDFFMHSKKTPTWRIM